MSELPSVSPGEVIASDHINDIMLRTVQRYATAAERSVETSTPAAGELSYLEDTGTFDIYTGSSWVKYLSVLGGTMIGDLNMGGNVLNGVPTPSGDTSAVPLSLLNERAPLPEPWVTPSLSSGWSSFGTSIAYMRDSAGNTQLRGNMRNGTQTDGALIFVLTTTFRPPADLFVGFAAQSGTVAMGIISAADGSVRVTGTWSVGSYLSMSGVLFSTLA